METLSAGTANDSDTPVDHELVDWADAIFVMERRHRTVIQSRFRNSLRQTRIVCLDIPDDYEFMDRDLVVLLESRMARFFA
ncbi:MAG: hypothetical protein R3E14_03610 [Erythrobacter sp.]